MNYNEFSDLLLAGAKNSGFEDAEIFMSASESFSVSTLKGEIFKYQNSANRGISFRGTYKGRIGYSYSEWIDENAVDFLLKEAMQNSEIIESPEQDLLYGGGGEYKEVNIYSQELSEVSIGDKIQAALDMENAALKADESIKAVDHNGVGYGESTVCIKNTYGLDVSYKSNEASAYSYTRAVNGDETKTGGEFWQGRNWSEYSPEKVGVEAAKDSAAKLNAESFASGKYKIVMKNTAFADFLSTFSSVFNAENVQKGFSLLNGKLNTKIASDAFTLCDNPLDEASGSARPFDAEGVAAYNKSIIEDGILKTYLHNLKTAKKDGVESTGNASRSYKGSISVSPINLCVKTGWKSLDELIAEVGDGLLIVDLGGLHSGTNTVSGDFSLSAEGFLIEGGKLTKSIEQITVAGNFYNVMKDITGTANDFRYSSLGTPSVYIRELAVAGNK